MKLLNTKHHKMTKKLELSWACKQNKKWTEAKDNGKMIEDKKADINIVNIN